MAIVKMYLCLIGKRYLKNYRRDVALNMTFKIALYRPPFCNKTAHARHLWQNDRGYRDAYAYKV